MNRFPTGTRASTSTSPTRSRAGDWRSVGTFEFNLASRSRKRTGIGRRAPRWRPDWRGFQETGGLLVPGPTQESILRSLCGNPGALQGAVSCCPAVFGPRGLDLAQAPGRHAARPSSFATWPRLENAGTIGGMWIFVRSGFYSIACASKPDGSLDPDTVMVRARQKARLQNLQRRFPEIAAVEIRVTPKSDYRFRLIVPEQQWARLLAEMALEQTWSSFKSDAARYQGQGGADHVDGLHEIWAAMHQLQR